MKLEMKVRKKCPSGFLPFNSKRALKKLLKRDSSAKFRI